MSGRPKGAKRAHGAGLASAIDEASQASLETPSSPSRQLLACLLPPTPREFRLGGAHHVSFLPDERSATLPPAVVPATMRELVDSPLYVDEYLAQLGQDVVLEPLGSGDEIVVDAHATFLRPICPSRRETRLGELATSA